MPFTRIHIWLKSPESQKENDKKNTGYVIYFNSAVQRWLRCIPNKYDTGPLFLTELLHFFLKKLNFHHFWKIWFEKPKLLMV